MISDCTLQLTFKKLPHFEFCRQYSGSIHNCLHLFFRLLICVMREYLYISNHKHVLRQTECRSRWDGSALSYWSFFIETGFPSSSAGKESACNAGDTGDVGSIPGSGRSPGGGNGNLLRYSCLGNPMDRGAWRAIVHGVAKSQT